MKIQSLAAIGAVVLLAASSIGSATAQPNVETPADVIHPNIHSKVGRGDGTNANPNGNGNGGAIHGIGNVPGQNADNGPSEGDPGFADQLETVHGGIGAKNPNAN